MVQSERPGLAAGAFALCGVRHGAMSITISLDPARQDLDAIHRMLAGTYWSPGIRREVPTDRWMERQGPKEGWQQPQRDGSA
jgi:hypothetical protein